RTQTISKHYARILSQWPVDKLRPEVISFQTLLRKRIDAAPVPQIVQENTAQAIATTPSSKIDASREMEEVNALYSLLEDRYSKKYPLSRRMMQPASIPTYYADFAREVEAMPNRSWLGNTIVRWKKYIRMK
ncbi:hypothetical protein LTR28_003516, partial [Elasticomyces elasticus]